MSGFHGMLKYQIEEFVILHSKIKSFQHLAAYTLKFEMEKPRCNNPTHFPFIH